MKPREKEVIDIAIKKLEEAIQARVTTQVFNGDIDLLIKIDDHNLIFNAEVRLFLNKARLGLVLNQIRTKEGIPILITGYVNPELMIRLENNRVNFIDAEGNAFINEPPLFIKIKGNKPGEKKKTKNIIRPFYTAALQTIFTILCNPGIERETVRKIAELAGVAHGTVHTTLKDLERQGYLPKNANRLTNKKDLLERWVTLYPEKLKPKYIIGRYAADNDDLNKINLENFDALWGGEVAAARLTNYLQPFIYTIYINEERQGEFTLRNRLKKHPQGKLEMIKKFWKFHTNDYKEITHPILIYADLLATGDPRNIETAHIIYEKYIAGYIEKD